MDPTSVDLAVSPAFFTDLSYSTEDPESIPVIGSVHSLETFSSNDGPGIRSLGEHYILQSIYVYLSFILLNKSLVLIISIRINA